MKKIAAGLLAVVLLSSVAPPVGRTNGIPSPPIPERKTAREPEVRQETAPLYAVAAGITAMALTASLITLRVIRKKSLASQMPPDAGERTPEDAGQITREVGSENTPVRDR